MYVGYGGQLVHEVSYYERGLVISKHSASELDVIMVTLLEYAISMAELDVFPVVLRSIVVCYCSMIIRVSTFPSCSKDQCRPFCIKNFPFYFA